MWGADLHGNETKASGKQSTSELEQALAAARAAAEAAARENAAAQAELGQLALRSAALEEKASQLDEELKERTSDLQVKSPGMLQPLHIIKRIVWSLPHMISVFMAKQAALSKAPATHSMQANPACWSVTQAQLQMPWFWSSLCCKSYSLDPCSPSARL